MVGAGRPEESGGRRKMGEAASARSYPPRFLSRTGLGGPCAPGTRRAAVGPSRDEGSKNGHRASGGVMAIERSSCGTDRCDPRVEKGGQLIWGPNP